MKKHTACDLKSCFMCRGVLGDWKATIDIHRRNFTAKKGEVIIREGDPVTGIYFVYNGKVKVHKKWGDKELIVRFASNGAIIGHRGMNSNRSVYPISATALETTTLCFVDIEFFISTIKINHDLAFQLLLFFADELTESEKKMRNLALMSVKSRLAVALLHLRDQFGEDSEGNLDIDLSRQDLAAFAGATYETVFRTINDLVHEKLISLSGKMIRITDNEKLTSLTLE